MELRRVTRLLDLEHGAQASGTGLLDLEHGARVWHKVARFRTWSSGVAQGC